MFENLTSMLVKLISQRPDVSICTLLTCDEFANFRSIFSSGQSHQNLIAWRPIQISDSKHATRAKRGETARESVRKSCHDWFCFVFVLFLVFFSFSDWIKAFWLSWMRCTLFLNEFQSVANAKVHKIRSSLENDVMKLKTSSGLLSFYSGNAIGNPR